MLARLTAAQPLLAALLAEPKPTINITGVDPTSNLVWLGAKYVICFNIPPSVNSNPKNLVLYISDGSSGTYYPNSLGDASLPMPAGPQGCANMSVSRGVVIGPYTISMEDTYGRAFTTVSFFGDKHHHRGVLYPRGVVRWRGHPLGLFAGPGDGQRHGVGAGFAGHAGVLVLHELRVHHEARARPCPEWDVHAQDLQARGVGRVLV